MEFSVKNDDWATVLQSFVTKASDLIKQLTAMLQSFINGWKQVPAGATTTSTTAAQP